MCIICMEFDRLFDIKTAREMIDSARREIGSIPVDHLDEVEEKINKYEESQNP